MNFLFLETIGYESTLRLSGHHYAHLLARSGHRVVSLSSPVSPFHAFAKSNRAATSRRMEQHRAGFIQAPPDTPAGILHYVPKTLIPIKATFPLDQPWALRLSARTFQSDVLRRLDALEFVPDVVSLQSLIFYPLARHFQNRAQAILHYRIEDLLEGFADIPKSFLYFEKKSIDEADVVSITAENLGFKVTGKNASKLIFIPNGVDAEHFAARRPRPREYEKVTKPIALYVGALRAWFDWD
ncbi:hypothetical protein HY256_00725, partial [Candidatus Sumerlaeota bacterium]|nr:hypothetical protein [Candidatus Sumerlaeota bacterium]